jgi:hypothetical protein
MRREIFGMKCFNALLLIELDQTQILFLRIEYGRNKQSVFDLIAKNANSLITKNVRVEDEMCRYLYCLMK